MVVGLLVLAQSHAERVNQPHLEADLPEMRTAHCRILTNLVVGLDRLQPVQIGLGDGYEEGGEREHGGEADQGRDATALQEHKGQSRRCQRDEPATRIGADHGKYTERRNHIGAAAEPVHPAALVDHFNVLRRDQQQRQDHHRTQRIAVVVDERARQAIGEPGTGADDVRQSRLASVESQRPPYYSHDACQSHVIVRQRHQQHAGDEQPKDEVDPRPAQVRPNGRRLRDQRRCEKQEHPDAYRVCHVGKFARS